MIDLRWCFFVWIFCVYTTSMILESELLTRWKNPYNPANGLITFLGYHLCCFNMQALKMHIPLWAMDNAGHAMLNSL